MSFSEIGFPVAIASTIALLFGRFFFFRRTDHRITNTPAFDLHFAGMRNLGNTCFLNALLQSFASCQSLIDFLKSLSTLESNQVSRCLINILNQLQPSAVRDVVVSPAHLLSILSSHNPALSSLDQQDPHEIFCLLVELITLEFVDFTKNARLAKNKNKLIGFSAITNDSNHESYIATKSPNLFSSEIQNKKSQSMLHHSMIDSQVGPTNINTADTSNNTLKEYSRPIWEGTVSSHLCCHTCMSLVSSSPVKYSDLLLSIPTTTSQSFDEILTLSDCLSHYTEPEEVTGVECKACLIKSRIESSSSSSCDDDDDYYHYQEALHNLNCPIPSNHKQNGFVHGANNGEKIIEQKSVKSSMKKQQKINRLPDCLLVITLARSLHSGAKNNRFVSFPLSCSIDYFDSDPSSSVESSRRSIPNDSSVYRLQAVISHTSSSVASYGHYIVYKRFSSKQWIRISDEDVSRVPVDQVILCQAYMLFYEKSR